MKNLIILCFVLFVTAKAFGAKNSSFKVVDRELGVHHDNYSIESDKSRTSFLAHTNANLPKAADLYSFELIQAFNFDPIWLELLISQTTASYDSIFKGQHPANDSVTFDPATVSEQYITVGAGLGYRFNYIQELLEADDFYETSSAYLTYSMLDEDVTGEKFQGFGARADYGVHYRVGPTSHWGVRASYHIASLTRGETSENELRGKRSVTISSFTLALEYAIYF